MLRVLRCARWECDLCTATGPITMYDKRTPMPRPEGWQEVELQYPDTKVREIKLVCKECYKHIDKIGVRVIGATTDCGCTVTDAVDGVVDIDQCSRPGCPRAEGER